MRSINFVLALGTLIILGGLIALGIQAFYPRPQMPQIRYPITAPADRQSFNRTMRDYEARQSVYKRNLFYI